MMKRMGLLILVLFVFNCASDASDDKEFIELLGQAGGSSGYVPGIQIFDDFKELHSTPECNVIHEVDEKSGDEWFTCTHVTYDYISYTDLYTKRQGRLHDGVFTVVNTYYCQHTSIGTPDYHARNNAKDLIQTSIQLLGKPAIEQREPGRYGNTYYKWNLDYGYALELKYINGYSDGQRPGTIIVTVSLPA